MPPALRDEVHVHVKEMLEVGRIAIDEASKQYTALIWVT